MTHGEEARRLVLAFNAASPGAKALFVRQFIVEVIGGVRDEARLRSRCEVVIEAIHEGLALAGQKPVEFLLSLGSPRVVN